MGEIAFNEPTPADVDALARNMRAVDRAECIAAGQNNLHAVVARGVRMSAWAEAVHIDGRLACIFGVAPLGGALLSDIGVPWLLGTDVISRNRSAFMRHATRYIPRMLQTYPQLMNVVHARNKAAVQWLRHVGFQIDPAEAYGPHGEMFHPFRMSTHV